MTREAMGRVTASVAGNRGAAVIKDVARLAGVSIPTVSRYINGTARVSPEKSERIAQAIKLLDYKPNVVARALVNRMMDSVMMLTSLGTSWATTQINRGAEKVARDNGFLFGVTSLDGVKSDDVEDTVDRVIAFNHAGVLLSESDEVAMRVLRLIPGDMPMVLIGGSGGDAPYQVMPSEREGGRLVAEHLLKLGHGNVVHVHRREGPNNNTRTMGWRDAMKARGTSAMASYEVDGGMDEIVALGHALAKDRQITAIFAGNDETAIALIRGLRDEGLRVPEDVSVAGYNDQLFAEVWEPPLTSYRQNFVEIGEAAFTMLLAQIMAKRAGWAMPDPECRVIEGELIVRESTAKPHA